MERRQKQKKPIFYKHRPDYLITVLVVLLIGIGMILIFSTGWISILKKTAGASEGNGFIVQQVRSFFIGVVAWALLSKWDYHHLQKYARYIFIASILVMFLVLVPGISLKVNGATRWVNILGFNFQPVEFFKLGTVIFAAAWLAKNKNNLSKPKEGLFPLLAILAIVAFLTVYLQKDMGSSMVIVLSLFAMYFVAGAGWANIVAAFSVLILGVGALAIAAPYRLARVLTFLGKSDDQSAAAYHINQALIAIGSGGILGRGLGKSLQAYGYLPEATNDSIFAIIGEEAGMWGAGIIIAVFALLFWRSIRIAKSAPDDFGKLLAFGIAFWIGFQALINVSAMLGLIPLTGIPLPFVSYGGTSLVALLAAVGILQNISKFTYKEVYDEDSSSRGRNDRSHIAGVSRHRVNTKA
jgi:cell division protein FtsW